MADIVKLSPPIDPATEQESVLFDYGLLGIVIQTVLSVTCKVAAQSQGQDASPASRLIGPAVIVPSPSTLAPGTGVIQQIGNMLPGVLYGLQCTVLTTDGQHVNGDALIECRTPF